MSTSTVGAQTLEWFPGQLNSFYKTLGEPVSTKEYKTLEKVKDLQEKVAKDKDVQSMVILGALYTVGCTGVLDEDCPQAYRLVSDAAERSDSDAIIYRTLMILGAKQGEARDREFEKVIEKVLRAAEQKIPGAVFSLGLLERCAENTERMAEHFSIAAQLGCSMAKPYWGEALLKQGKIDEGEAVCVQAAKEGHLVGFSFLADYYKDTKKGLGYMQQGAEAGEVNSMQMLAAEYLKGLIVTPDEGKAKELLTKCAGEDNWVAMAGLGRIYADERVGTQAVFWYKKAFSLSAQSSYADSIFFLYKYGLGDLPQNDLEANEWQTKSLICSLASWMGSNGFLSNQPL